MTFLIIMVKFIYIYSRIFVVFKTKKNKSYYKSLASKGLNTKSGLQIKT